MHSQHRWIWLSALSVVFSSLSYAAGISVKNGSVLSLGDGSLTLNCNELNIANGAQVSLAQGSVTGVTHMINNGQLDGEQGQIDFTGDWNQLGTFDSGSSVINLVDGCSLSTTTVSGSSAFAQFSATTSTARSVNFAAGLTQSFSQSLILSGSNGNLLNIRSTVADQLASLDLAPAASQTIAFVDVADNQAIGQPLAPGAAETYNSVSSGNTPGWFISLGEEIFSSSFE